ncbi:hypothetical protein SM030_00082 [Vibrio phage vB_VpaS_sm030]|nr:hypothetical protein 13VO501A_gene0110 [Vibrio phage 13VO501A]CAH0448215.1 hypothetical protein SM030_00082 [Vibrio phage vB_VpaS_sm030]CAI5930263.1 hypothetical protein SM031_00082 [Vibrio phage vB_VpaS_sm030]CAI6013144.1 hypothetical protein SM032_00082 [Vibrio phage vB_VpaS_sm030]
MMDKHKPYDHNPLKLVEGSPCPEIDCEGELEYLPENCTCHINPPCSACEYAPLKCGVCGYEHEEEDLV